jgi:predicted thioesterase
MTPGLDPGNFAEVEFTVTPEMCPHFDGVLVHPVVATWTLVHRMEVAGRKLLAPHLGPDEEGIGAHISIDHRWPAPVGARVVVRAEVESCTARRLVCITSARCGTRELARGRFVQVILPKTRLQSMLDRHRS